MGTSLNGLTPAGTYPGLIKTGDNAPIDGTLKTLSDGNGNNLPMAVSTTAVNFTGTLTQAGATLQPTLVSGTNIKTINGTSVLGSGDIVTPYTPPSGVSGAIQFSNGSAFASDAANLFWDDTNNRLGVGTNSPSATAEFVSNTLNNAMFSVGPSFATGFQIFNTNSTSTPVYGIGLNGSYINTRITFFDTLTFRANGTGITEMTSSEVRVGGATGARMAIKGSGSTLATTSLLVQNSGGTLSFKVDDGGNATIGSANGAVIFNQGYNNVFSQNQLSFYSAATNIRGMFAGGQGLIISKNTGTTDLYPTAILAIDSTTQGFLPPRMTTTQKNAIATPAAGLVVYDSTTNKLCCYNGSTWNDLF